MIIDNHALSEVLNYVNYEAILNISWTVRQTVFSAFSQFPTRALSSLELKLIQGLAKSSPQILSQSQVFILAPLDDVYQLQSPLLAGVPQSGSYH